MPIPKYAVATKTLQALATLGQLKSIGRRSTLGCMALIPPAAGIANDKLQVWVNVQYAGYREAFRRAWIEAWESCLSRGLSRNEKALVIEPGQDIDHLFPRAQALRHGYSWLRLFESFAPANRGWRDAFGWSQPFDDIYYVDPIIWRKWMMKTP